MVQPMKLGTGMIDSDGSIRPVQGALADISPQLSDVTFVVVDLETTGGSPATSAITEFGAVKVRGGEVLGEFATLVNPGVPIPASITVLTGITTAMVVDAPRLEQVLPSFLEFINGAVLVAHNARFDIGFLKAACTQLGYPWPGNQVVDTVQLARRALTRDETPNYKLATLARVFGSPTTPSHRALDDARATVDVLHGTFSRLAPLGISYLDDLACLATQVPAALRKKRTLADHLPTGPGVYLFEGPDDEVLYVGTSVNVRARVRQYFTSSEKRTRMAEMAMIAQRVRAVECGSRLEAQVRELRLIAWHNPRYNRRSRAPSRLPWIRLTAEAFPRLSIVREVKADPGVCHIGPFSSTRTAELARSVLVQAVGLRQCTPTLPSQPRAAGPGCILGEIGTCLAPCHRSDVAAEYTERVERARSVMTTDPGPVVAFHAARIKSLASAGRFEEAGAVRDSLIAFLRAARRAQQFAALIKTGTLVAARPHDGGWEIISVGYGRLTGSAWAQPGSDPADVVRSLQLSAEVVEPPVSPAPAAHPEETELILAWLSEPGVRLIEIDHPWSMPIGGAARADGTWLQGAVAAAG